MSQARGLYPVSTKAFIPCSSCAGCDRGGAAPQLWPRLLLRSASRASGLELWRALAPTL